MVINAATTWYVQLHNVSNMFAILVTLSRQQFEPRLVVKLSYDVITWVFVEQSRPW